MSIQSMTGFARAGGASGDTTWFWEAKSVNNRGLDIRLRLPAGHDALEPKVREAVTRRFARGSINLALTLSRTAPPVRVEINDAVLAQVTAAAERVRQLAGADAPRADGLLALKGVLEVIEENEDEAVVAARQAAMLASAEEVLEGLAAARASEGGRLRVVLDASVAEISRLAALAEASPARQPDAIAARLKEQIARIMEAGQGFDAQRLHQEAMLLATKVDIEEELKRLKAHVEAGRDLLAAGGAVGRKLDFLAQELNREANTLTSKANDSDLARVGLALKVVIDQIREQVQNIE